YGQELQQNIFAPWRSSYVSYDMLKYELKNRQKDHGWTAQDEKEFTQMLDTELCKVYEFVNAKLTEIDARILYCERTIQTLQANPAMVAHYTMMDEALTEILFDLNDVSKFTRVNYVAIQKMLKKHDKWTGIDLKQVFVSKLRERPLDKQRFDVAIVYISALHNICRNRGNQSKGDSTLGEDQHAFERATAKYWIHPDNITEVKAIIMLHLPVLIYDKKKKWEHQDAAVSSVYFDNPNFDLYTTRLQRDEGSESIRFRWYGSIDEKDIYIERKTHHAEWLDGASVKDRFRLKEPQVDPFMTGKLTADAISHDLAQSSTKKSTVDHVHFIANGIQKSLKEKQLEPMVRVFYNRTAFQLPDDQRLRISLDSDLTFLREDHLSLFEKKAHHWRREDVGIDYPFHKVPDQDILRFPYAILETKLQTHLGQQPPEWLTSLIESHLVHEVPRFSKYLHGASYFYRERLALLPWWLSELNMDIRKPRAENSGLTRSRSFKPLIDGKYRRAMIEEKEKENRQAIVNNKPTELLASDSTVTHVNTLSHTPSYDPVKQYEGILPPVPPEKPIGSTRDLSTSMQRPSMLEKLLKKKKKKDDIEAGIKKPKVKVRVEPKVFFANERTFISWLQFCALLLTIALNLLNFGDNVSRTVGGIFIALAGGIAVYALYRFEKRA
ncbi:vacuolar transporter chaperone, partial [Rhizopus stolonifer]